MRRVWQFLPALLIAGLILGAPPAQRWREARGAERLAAAAAVWYADPLVEEDGMSIWEVSGAGDASYNGTYTESGTWNDLPAYTNGSRWLFWNSMLSRWQLFSTKEMACAYYGTGADLPATPWAEAFGTSPAPTVAAGGHAITGHSISGTLLETDDTPVAGVVMRATKGGVTVDSDPSDASGNYSIEGLEDGTWNVTYLSGAAEPHRIATGGLQLATVVIAGADATLDWVVWWGATGTILCGGSPLPYVKVDIYGGYGVLRGSAQTNSSGVWSWVGDGTHENLGAYYNLAGYGFSPSVGSIDLTGHAPATGVDATATLRNKTLAGAAHGLGEVSCELTMVRALQGQAAGVGAATCALTVISAASKHQGAYYRYLTRLWTEA